MPSLEESICRIEVWREEAAYLVRVISDIDGTKDFRHPDLDTLLRDVSMDLQLTYSEFAEKGDEFVDPEELETFQEEDY